MRALFTVFFVLVLALPAFAQTPGSGGYAKDLFGQLHPEDQGLARGWQDHLQDVLTEIAKTSDDPESIDSIDEFERLIAAPHLPFSIGELDGNWRMRSLQATDLGAFIYQYFPARIYPQAQAHVLDKNTGSQRHYGFMAQLDDTTVFFVGALYYGYESPRFYSSMAGVDTTPEQREFDAVAEIYKIGENHFLMAFAPRDNRARLYEIIK